MTVCPQNFECKPLQALSAQVHLEWHVVQHLLAYFKLILKFTTLHLTKILYLAGLCVFHGLSISCGFGFHLKSLLAGWKKSYRRNMMLVCQQMSFFSLNSSFSHYLEAQWCCYLDFDLNLYFQCFWYVLYRSTCNIISLLLLSMAKHQTIIVVRNLGQTALFIWQLLFSIQSDVLSCFQKVTK